MNVDYTSIINSLGIPYLIVVLAGLMPIVRIFVALAIAFDARSTLKKKGATALLPWWLWFLATLTMGFIVVIAYWLFHYSSIAKGNEEIEKKF